MWVGKKGPVKRGAKNHDQHQYFTAGHSSPERVAIANTVLWLSLTSLQASYSLTTPSAQAIFFSSYVSPTLISLLFHYTTLYTTHAPFLSCFSTQYCTSPKLYFCPVSVHNTVYYPRSICVLFQHTSLYITHALFLSSFIRRHCITPRSNPLLFQYTTLYITPDLFLSCFSTQNFMPPKLYLCPVSVHNTVYHPRSISLLFQYTTLYITHALFLSCFSTQHCISPTL